MSKIDTQFGQQERNDLLAEVRVQLPAFLGSQSTEQVDPVGDVSDLLNLRHDDLTRVTAVHVALSDPVRQFTSSLPNGLRHPITSSVRPPQVGQAIRGPIDWGATIREQAGRGAATVYVTRPATRVFDTPENRALAWVLDRLQAELGRVQAPPTENPASAAPGWVGEVTQMLSSTQAARRHYWLRDVSAVRPDQAARRRLRAARSAFYAVELLAVADTLRRYIEEPTPADITELLSARYFEPSLDWQLFEVVIALRLEAAFRAVCQGRRKSRLLVGGTRGPFARFDIGDHEIRLWYQAWPSAAAQSVHRTLRNHYGIAGSDVRPDLVVERVDKDGVSDALLLELKASRRSAYLSEGVFQLLGYLKDRPELFTKQQPAAWLVAPKSPAFETAEPLDHQVWVIDADNVAAAAVRHFGLAA